MAVQVEPYRNPDELAADLVALSRVGWSRVWGGFSEGDPTRWCEQFGWTLESIARFEHWLTVLLQSGGKIYVRQDPSAPSPRPATSADLNAWRASADTAADNEGLFEAIDKAWPEYLAKARQAIGEPVVLSSWDDPAFPASTRWPDRERRLRYRQPYRLARWYVPDAMLELAPTPSNSAVSPSQGGGIILSVGVRPTEPPEQ